MTRHLIIGAPSSTPDVCVHAHRDRVRMKHARAAIRSVPIALKLRLEAYAWPPRPRSGHPASDSQSCREINLSARRNRRQRLGTSKSQGPRFPDSGSDNRRVCARQQAVVACFSFAVSAIKTARLAGVRGAVRDQASLRVSNFVTTSGSRRRRRRFHRIATIPCFASPQQRGARHALD